MGNSIQHKQRSYKYLTIAMVFSMFLWGLGWPSGKVLSRYCSAINFSFYRYIVVIVTMSVLLPALGFNFRIKKKGIPVFVISGILLSVYSYFYFMGLKQGLPGAGGVLVTTLNPIIAYSLGVVMNRRLPSSNELFGLILGCIACCTLLKVWDNTSAILHSGNVYFLLAALTWAIMSKFTAKGATYGSSMGFSLWQYLITLLCLLPFTNFGEMRSAMQIKDMLFWVNLFFSSAMVTALATTTYFFTTTHLGAEKASSFLFLVPMAAAISSWVFLGEHILPHTAIGGIIGIVAVYTMNRRNKTDKKTY